MYKDTITLFNRKEGRTGDTWYPTIIAGVHLTMDKAAILAKYGPEANDTAALHVPYVQTEENKMVAGKPWMPPKQWDIQISPESALTFTGGNSFDFFWLGQWPDTEPIQDADYEADGDFYTYMNRTHDYVFAITAVGGPYSLIPHFEIMGK